MKHRFKHLFEDHELLVTEAPTAKFDAVFDTVEDEQLSSGDNGFDDNDNHDDDDGDDDDGDYEGDKIAVAEDEKSILSTAKVVFQRDEKTGKTIMICQVEEWDVPDDIADGETMFKSDIIFRPYGEYSSPKKRLKKVDPKFFKNKNWREKP